MRVPLFKDIFSGAGGCGGQTAPRCSHQAAGALIVAGFGPQRMRSSSVAIAAISSSVSGPARKASKLEAIRSALVERDSTERPRCRCQRRISCAGLTPRRAAAALTGAASKLRP